MDADDLAIGDRVQRAPFHGEASRIGTVCDVYSCQPPRGDLVSLALYAVRWEDSGYTERGYLRGGLIRCLGEGGIDV